MDDYACEGCGTAFDEKQSLRKHYMRRRLCQAARKRRLQDLSNNPRQAPEGAGRASSPLDGLEDEGNAEAAGGAGAEPMRNDEAAGAQDVQADAMAMDVDDGVEAGAGDEPHAAEPPPESPPFERRQHHGYATIEVHKTAAQVIRWEFVDEHHERSPTDILRHREWFKLGEWLAGLAISDGKRAEYFEIRRHLEGSPWQSLNDFQRSVDALPRGPDWIEDSITVTTDEGSETFQLPRRCPLAIVRYLIGLTRLRDHMCYAPEKHMTTTFDGRRIRVWSEMWTGEWWWRLQGMLKEGVTIAPFIIATDETNLTKLSGSQVAWPVYASIGNIRKAVRRRPSEHGMMLIGFLPVAKLTWITNDEERRVEKWKLFHASMAKILDPLKDVPEEGVEMRCADGGVRKVVTPLAVHIGDWPEVCKVVSNSLTRCPTCITPFHERGDLGAAALLRTNPRTLRGIRLVREGHVATQVGLGLRPVTPYWDGHDYATGPASIQPDLLHQLWKGVYLVHLFEWWKKIIGLPALDERYMGLPRHYGHRHFTVGISSITQWTGNEARATAHAFLPIVAGEQCYKAVRATRGIMDFTYRARMPQLDEDDLKEMADDLKEFHDNKGIFRTRGAHTSRFGFNGIAKLHFIRHYPHLTREMGTPDNFSTETPERLHKDFVKEPYELTSHVNPLMQIAAHLGELEAWMFLHSELEAEGVIERKRRRARAEEEPIDDAGVVVVEDEYHANGDAEDGEAEDSDESDEEYGDKGKRADGRVGSNRGLWVVAKGGDEPRGPLQIRRKEYAVHQFRPQITWASRPVIAQLQGTEIVRHRDNLFLDLVNEFVSQVDANLAFQIDEYCDFAVWTRISLTHDYLPFAPLVGRLVEGVSASPPYYNSTGRITKPAFFDTVLLDEFPEKHGLLRYRTARVRLIFQLPFFCDEVFPEPLVLVELFKPFDTNVSGVHRLPTVAPLSHHGQRVRRIVPISTIAATCQLVAHYPRLDLPYRITAETDLLSIATRFYLSRHSSYYFLSVMDHWRRLLWRPE